jgi:hypothetical protein
MIARFLISLVLILGVIAPLPALAVDPYGGLANCSSAGDSTVCKTKGNTTDPITGTNGVLVKVTNVIAFVAGAAAIFFIIFSGIQYITAQGDSQQISKAKQSIIYASVGLIMIVLARQVIGFVLSKI